jgi:hypothetical protein
MRALGVENSEMNPSAAEQNKKREHRHRVLKGASILQTIKESEIKVTVRNMHERGAELRVPDGVKIPSEFLLYVPIDGIGYRSVVRWREGNRIGIQFTGKEPKPHWHYG